MASCSGCKGFRFFLTFGATDLDGSFGECFICNTGAGEALVAEGVAADVVSKCSLCLLPYHGRCASEILDHVSKSADMANFSFPEDVDIAALDPPDVFTSIDGGRGSTRILCSLCAAYAFPDLPCEGPDGDDSAHSGGEVATSPQAPQSRQNADTLIFSIQSGKELELARVQIRNPKVNFEH